MQDSRYGETFQASNFQYRKYLILLSGRSVAWGGGPEHRVNTEWQWPLSGVHSIMVVTSAQPGETGGARPPPFILSTTTSKVVVYTLQLRGQIHFPYFSSAPIFILWALPSERERLVKTGFPLSGKLYKLMNSTYRANCLNQD
jgi:hypothetical protein